MLCARNNTVLFVDPKLKSMSKFTFYCALSHSHSTPPSSFYHFFHSLPLIPSRFLFFFFWRGREVKINICKETKFHSMYLCSSDSCQLKLSSSLFCFFLQLLLLFNLTLLLYSFFQNIDCLIEKNVDVERLCAVCCTSGWTLTQYGCWRV